MKLGVDTSIFAEKNNLISLKLDDDQLDIDTSKTVPFPLNNLKTVEDKLDIINHKLFLLTCKKFW